MRRISNMMANDTARSAIVVMALLAYALPISAQSKTLVIEQVTTLNADLTYVGEAVVDGSGNLFLSQPADRQLALVKTNAGAPMRVGRAGEGPGEFRNVAHVGLTTRGFWAFDAILKRVSLYAGSGAFDRTLPIPADILAGTLVGSQAAVFPALLAMIGRDSLLLAATGSASAALGTIGLGEKHFYVGRAGADRFQRIATLPASPGCALVTPTSTVTLPNCAIPKVLTRPDGRGMVFVTTTWDPQAKVAVVSHNVRGEVIYRRVIAMTPPRVERETMDSNTARLKRRFSGMSLPSLPTYYPPLTGAVVGTDGAVWLGVRGDSGAQAWRVLDPSGKDAGQVLLPSHSRVVAADRSTIWVVTLDEDDVPSLVKYRVPALAR